MDFEGKKLCECLDVIHGDIISIWNIKAKMSVLVNDLVSNPSTPTYVYAMQPCSLVSLWHITLAMAWHYYHSVGTRSAAFEVDF